MQIQAYARLVLALWFVRVVSNICVGNVVISKKNPMHTQDHGDALQREGRVLSTYPRRPLSGALWQRGWCSRTSSRSTDPQYRTYGTSAFSTRSSWWRPANSRSSRTRRRVSSARRRGDDVDEATVAGLRLSTATIWPRWIMVEGAPHTARRDQWSTCVS